MKRLLTGLALALLLPACMHKSQDEKRWDDLDRKTVILMVGYEKIVHSNPDCPKLKTERGTPIKCTVRDARLVDENGVYQNGPEIRFPLCSCVR